MLVRFPRQNKCICPYCANAIDQDKFHYRLTSYSTQEEIESKTFELANEPDEEEGEKLKNEIKCIEKFILKEKEDEKLQNYWKPYKSGIPKGSDSTEYRRATFSIEDTEYLFKGEDEEALTRDEEGFLLKVKDYYGKMAGFKLCPHCHNKLPRSYGKNEVIQIALLGTTGSGKTVYLRVLEQEIENVMQKAGVIMKGGLFIPDNAPDYGKIKVLNANDVLPIGTTGLQQPIFIDVQKNYTNEMPAKNVTIVIHDMEGEKFKSEEDFINYTDLYLRNCNAYLIFMDPAQFPQIANGEDIFSMNTVITRLSQQSTTERINSVAAILFSKSDEIADFIDNNYIAGDDVLRKDDSIFCSNDIPVKGFDKAAYGFVRGGMCFLMNQLDNSKALRDSINALFKPGNIAYFAVSSLGFKPIPFFKKNATSEMLKLNEETARRIKSIIAGKMHDANTLLTNKGRDKSGIEKTIEADDINQESVVGYFIETRPEPRRIEEPLLWIMYKLGIIEGID